MVVVVAVGEGWGVRVVVGGVWRWGDGSGISLKMTKYFRKLTLILSPHSTPHTYNPSPSPLSPLHTNTQYTPDVVMGGRKVLQGDGVRLAHRLHILLPAAGLVLVVRVLLLVLTAKVVSTLHEGAFLLLRHAPAEEEGRP